MVMCGASWQLPRRQQMHVLLLVLCLCVVVATTGVHGATMQLHSSKFTYAPRYAVEQNIAANSAKHCVVVSLDMDNLASALVQFRYRSNVTTPHLRLPLVLTVHKPDPSDHNVAQLTSDSYIAMTEIYDHVKLQKYEEARSRSGGQPSPDSIITFTFQAKREADDEAMDGTYAVCFSLDPGSKLNKRTTRSVIIERVDIDVLEATSSRRRQSYYGAPNVPASDRERRRSSIDAVIDPDGVYERALRNIYGVGDDADLNELMFKPDVLTSTEMTELQNQLLDVQNMLQEIMQTTSWAGQRDARMRRTSESTFTRIWVATLCILVVISVVVWATFYYTKSIIIKRKLI